VAAVVVAAVAVVAATAAAAGARHQQKGVRRHLREAVVGAHQGSAWWDATERSLKLSNDVD
jgi:ABC-type sugar transport system substrate-binding protein